MSQILIRQPRTSCSELIVCFVHVGLVTAFAFAQPLFDVISRAPEIFVIRQSEPADILILVALVCLGIPTMALLLCALAGLLSPRLRRGVRYFFVAALLAIFALGYVGNAPSLLALPLAATLGTVFGIFYARYRPLEDGFSLTVMALATAVFPALFILNSQVMSLLQQHNGRAEISSPVPQSTFPIVFVIFDELPITSLMDDSGAIDAARYPNFAALARDAYWFRRAESVSGKTLISVPAILSSLSPSKETLQRLPTAEGFPNTVFTMLGSSYDMRVFESRTTLCPEYLCSSTAQQVEQWQRMVSLFSDLGIVYFHVLLPDDLASKLPVVNQDWDWMSFGNQNAQSTVPSKIGKRERFARFIDSIKPTARHAVYFIHSVLPHIPWNFLPSGKMYQEKGLPGFDPNTSTWGEDDWLVTQGYQRHLLQVGFVDRLIGEMVDKLRAEGLFDKSMIIVTADHGANFWANKSRRGKLDDFPFEILGVPLIVKMPNQQRGVVSDVDVKTIDIIPTLAEALQIRVPWQADGRSLFKSLEADQGGSSFDFSQYEPLKRKASLFGVGLGWDRHFMVGPHNELVGQPVGSIGTHRSNHEPTIHIVLDELAYWIDLESTMIPVDIAGRVVVQADDAVQLNLAVSVNGTIRAVTRTYTEDEETKFMTLVPENSYRSGPNKVEVFIVRVTESGGLSLEPTTREATSTFELFTSDTGDEVLVSSDGQRVPVRRGELKGAVMRITDMEQRRVTFRAWAVDIRNEKTADSIVLFVQGEFLTAGTKKYEKPGIVKIFGNEAYRWAGFHVDVPFDLLKEYRDEEVRAFAISAMGVASELNLKTPKLGRASR